MENWYNKCIVKYGVPVGETKLNFILITLESKRGSRQSASRKNLWFSYRDLHERLIFGSPWSGLSWSLHTLEHVPLRHCAFLMVTNRYIKQFLQMLVFMNNSILWSLFNKWKMKKIFYKWTQNHTQWYFPWNYIQATYVCNFHLASLLSVANSQNVFNQFSV